MTPGEIRAALTERKRTRRLGRLYVAPVASDLVMFSEIAGLAGATPQTVRNHALAGKLPYRIDGGHYYVTLDDAVAYIVGQR